MTKRVRVENADGQEHVAVIVEEWAKGDPNADPPTPDAMQGSKTLANPADALDYFCHSGNYLKVYEAPYTPEPTPQ